MATVELRFSALPSHVRTARLVAAAVARRAGVDETVLDEIRLAVGEACSRAVSLHRLSRPDEPVVVTLVDESRRFSIEVSDCVPAAPGWSVDPTGSADPAGSAGSDVPDGNGAAAPDVPDEMTDEMTDALPGSIGLAVISGLVDDLHIRTGAEGARIRMTWPARAALPPLG
ncbi:MAG: ATP-binding protein [Carbonactinosporaceae bacterium]